MPTYAPRSLIHWGPAPRRNRECCRRSPLEKGSRVVFTTCSFRGSVMAGIPANLGFVADLAKGLPLLPPRLIDHVADPTIYDVAEAAGVATSTVSRVLHAISGEGPHASTCWRSLPTSGTGRIPTPEPCCPAGATRWRSWSPTSRTRTTSSSSAVPRCAPEGLRRTLMRAAHEELRRSWPWPRNQCRVAHRA